MISYIWDSSKLIQREQLHHLLESQFRVPCIAQLLGVSIRTVFRRMEECGLSVTGYYGTMTDSELDNLVRAIKIQMPNAGYRAVRGQLMAMGSRVQWERIQDSMHRVDAAGVLSRLTQLGCTVRRTYSAQGPLALVHVDSNHKLVRHGFPNGNPYYYHHICMYVCMYASYVWYVCANKHLTMVVQLSLSRPLVPVPLSFENHLF